MEKIATVDEAGKETLFMTEEVMEVSTAHLEAKLFDVPGDYKEAKSATPKSKASQGGEDIITPLVEKMARAIVNAVAKK